MDYLTKRNLAFLLSIGTLPLGCSGDDGTTDGTTDETDGTTDGTTDATTDATTDSEPTDATTDDEPTTTGTPEGVCESYAQSVVTCYGEDYQQEYLDYCAQSLQEAAAWSPECLAGWESYYVCISALDCDPSDADVDACDALSVSTFFACNPTPGPVCAAYGDKLGDCSEDLDGPLNAVGCQNTIDTGTLHSEACGQAREDYFACRTALDCSELTQQGIGFPDPCEETFATAQEECDSSEDGAR